MASFFASDACRDGFIVRSVSAGVSDDGYATPLPAEDVRVPVRAYRRALGPGERGRMRPAEGAETAVPTWELILPITAPVSTPGWRYEDPEVTIRPVGVAADEGDVGLIWHVYGDAPGERHAD